MFGCGECDRFFPAGEYARNQHCYDTGHCVPDFECVECGEEEDHEDWCEALATEDDGYTCRLLRCSKRHATTRGRNDHEAYKHCLCGSCGRLMNNVNNVESHLNSQQHQGDRNYSLVRLMKVPATVIAAMNPSPPPTPPPEIHVPASLPSQPVQCPFCPYGHDRVSAVLMHLERGNCEGTYLKRSEIFNAVSLCDNMGTITNLNLHQPTRESSWDPVNKVFSCTLCERGFQTVGGLADHMNSEFHEFEWYHCPNADGCVSEFGLLSALMAHLEGEACGWKSFKELQEHGHVVLDPMRLI